MSAIAGIYHFNEEPISPEHSAGLMKVLEQFPANDIQTWQKENIFFGCHAQWITPESVGEKLPYYDHERQLAITADAIIDNREELFEKLQVKKSKQKTISDSELILLSYHKWEEESPKYLIGDFAFMIWDEKKQKLFGARDFSGSRTLYYLKKNNKFSFCTTIKPLLSLPYIEKKLNEQWLAEYLAISGMVDVVDASLTPYENIEQIPPSHSISVIENMINLKKYCSLTSENKLKLKSNEEYIEAFRDVFQEAVSSRLRTSRKIGAQLSGGLDSGSVVSFAAKSLRSEKKLLHTFSYIPRQDFKDFTPKYMMTDESPLINSTVQFVGGIKPNYLDFNGKDSFTEIDSLLSIMEMPYKFVENSFWLKGMFEKAQSEDIGVLLNGGRGNLSISWGSALEYYAILLKKVKWIRLFKELNQYSINTGGNRLGNLPFIAKTAFPFINKKFSKSSNFTNPILINSEFAKRKNIFNKLQKHGIGETGWLSSSDIYQQRKDHFEEVFHWNASNTLSAKLSLPYSLWKRDPTNDIRVIRFCLSLPEEQYVQNGLDRALIRKSTESYLPDEVRLNQRTVGVQAADWIHRIIPYWEDILNEFKEFSKDKRVLEFLNVELIRESLSNIHEVRSEHAYKSEYRVLMRSLVVYRFLKQFN